MLRLALLATTILFVGCASTRTNSLAASDSNETFAKLTPNAEVVVSTPDAMDADDYVEPFGALETEAPLSDDAPAPVALSLAQEPEAEKGQHSSRFTIKGGYYGSSEDELEDGYIVNLSWMRFSSKIFAWEVELGYLDADGTDQGVDTDVWAIPLMLNGRLNLPVWILDLYAGLGIGGFYYDIEGTAGALSASDDGFLFGGNGFVGATINVGKAMSLGLEGKYYVTDEISSFNQSLDAYAVMLTLGFSR